MAPLRFVASFILSFVESASVQGLASDKVCDKAHDKDWGELLKLATFDNISAASAGFDVTIDTTAPTVDQVTVSDTDWTLQIPEADALLEAIAVGRRSGASEIRGPKLELGNERAMSRLAEWVSSDDCARLLP